MFMKNFTFYGKAVGNICVALVSMFLLFSTKQANAQLIGTEDVNANFGIDADFYSNLLQNGTFSVPASGTDDWFQQLPGTGTGVIDTAGAATMRAYFAGASQAARNITFTRSMSAPFNSFVNGRRWIDAVYGRDNNSAGGNADSSVFGASSQKNFFNPKKWTFGIGGIPAKNDIIDALAHLRREGGSGTPLWGYGAATIVSPNGDSHVDFEFFRQNITYTPGNNNFNGNSGVDSGHTAWKFAADGRVITPGDVIFSFDFTNGGTVPVLTIRAWVDPGALPGGNFAGFNSSVNKPFTFTGIFDTDAGGAFQAAPFGYAEIRANDNITTYAHARVNLANQTIDATPFGFLSGPQAVYVTDNEPLTFMEFSINLTAFGLDAAVTQNDPCAILFGSLLIKTRSSTSFIAELKDFAGPYEFGRRVGVGYTLSATSITCANPTATTTLNNLTPPVPASTVVWSGAGLVSGQGTAQATWNTGGWKYVMATFAGTQCTRIDSVFISGNITPPNVSIDPALALNCTRTTVTLTAHSTTAGATFAWSGGGTGATKNVTSGGTYSVVATDPGNGCTASATVSVSQSNTPPNVTISGAQQLTCTRTSITLTANSTTSGATFAWSGGGTGSTKSVSAQGTYSVTATDPANGCTASISVSVSQNITPPNLTIDLPATLTCSVTSVTLTAHSTTSGATFAWGGGGTGPTKVVTGPATYSVTVTDTNNGCTASGMVGVQQNITPPDAHAGPDAQVSCTVLSVTLQGSSSTSGAQFLWTATNGGHIVMGGTTLTPTVDEGGTYILRVTNPANGCVARDTAEVGEINNQPTCSLSAPQYLPLGNSTGNTLTATLQNYSTAVWSVTSTDGSWSITNDDGAGTVTYTAGNAGVVGNFKVVLSNATGVCKDSCMVSFLAASGDVFCGMTQGFYGNYNGKYCDQRSKQQLLHDILVTPLTVGILGIRSLTFDSSRTTCIIERLPAGGPADMLPGGNNQLPANMTFLGNCNTTPLNIPLKNGRFRNVFLGQTITLGLNLRLGTALASLRLTGNWFVTAGIASGLNNLICDAPGQPILAGSERYYHIPQSVLDYLGANNTVADLFALANQSLAGTAPSSPSRSDINEAVSSINEGFDGCRRFIGFSQTGPPLKTDESVNDQEDFYDEALNVDATLSVYPNPFSNATSIQFILAESARVNVEVIDATGRIVKQLFRGMADKEVVYETQLDAATLANGVYIVRVATENMSIKKQIVLQR
jgi:hypothetical protein